MSSVLTGDDVGVAAVTASEMSVEHAGRLAAALDDSVYLARGSDLPLLWHWAFFGPAVPTAELGHDGHPRMASGGPADHLPRRMWAGGRVSHNASLRVGEPATRRSRVSAAEKKSGRSGELLVVTITHEIHQDGAVAIVESQDLVYRAAPADPVSALIPGPAPAVPSGGWVDIATMTSVKLFRFSALTFNTHRIHYDRPYARDEEGYPDLVVHGPLTAILLANSARRRIGGGVNFEFRATAPLFADAPFHLVGSPHDGGARLKAIRTDGITAMTANFE